jgi:hypothetical protein
VKQHMVVATNACFHVEETLQRSWNGPNICKLQMLSEMEASSLYMSLYCNYHGTMIINIPCCYCAYRHQGILELENWLKDAHI